MRRGTEKQTRMNEKNSIIISHTSGKPLPSEDVTSLNLLAITISNQNCKKATQRCPLETD